jgi:hypothetical protein
MNIMLQKLNAVLHEAVGKNEAGVSTFDHDSNGDVAKSYDPRCAWKAGHARYRPFTASETSSL